MFQVEFVFHWNSQKEIHIDADASEGYSAQIQPNYSKLMGRRFTVQTDNNSQNTAKETQGKQMGYFSKADSSHLLPTIRRAFQLLETKMRAKLQ